MAVWGFFAAAATRDLAVLLLAVPVAALVTAARPVEGGPRPGGG
ncbi:hypothetical protein [Micromonospora fulviviridis]|uniref:Energy-coupling factor transporter transmembrane protein EcfT n=1 Tax=Micromonospora fulviviridis TaxID=47860 RepID=A0ABV2VR90_9ACTN